MSAAWVTVPDGKRQHIGILIAHDWWPVCGQWSGTSWFPARVQGSAGRSKRARCADCLKAADTIACLTEESR